MPINKHPPGCYETPDIQFPINREISRDVSRDISNKKGCFEQVKSV